MLLIRCHRLRGPLEASSAFTVAVSVYAGSRVEAARMAGDLFDGCLRSWRSRLVTEFGWFSRITHDSRHPAHVRSDLEADGTYRMDFALDVILNLKDLRQEERFNTIVIYPKDKEFAWPGKAESKLSFQADEDIAQQDALVITQMDQQPVGLVEATQLIAKGSEFEKQHNPAMAAQAYEQAFEKWNSNAKLANRIAAIYLVDLRQNAKALHYAKQALAIDKGDKVAALNAAIAAANMRDLQTAASYFDLSTQGEKPSQEALLSYALFREENRQYDQALQILDKFDALYGKSLDAMIASARILDKKGASAQAVQEYRSILGSGFSLPPDLLSL